MLHIKQIIPTIIRSLKRGRGLDENIICKESEKILKKNTPDIEVFFYKNKTLYIKCFNSITANEIFLDQERIINKINQVLKRKIVKKLVIKTN